MQKALIIIACLLLHACMMVGPDYKEPKTSVAKHWINNNASVKETPIHDAVWWEVFHDKNLTSLIHAGYHHNLSVQATGVHVLQARAQLAQAVGELYPQQQALVGSYDYNRIGGGSLQSLLPSSFDTASLGFSANWEVDFWGKYRRAIQSNNAIFLASLAAYDHALVSLTADIAGAYINIRTKEALIQMTKENIRVQAMGLKLARSRYRNGQTSLLDVEQAQTELSQTQATLPTLMSQLQQQKDVLAILLGTTPNEIDALLIKKQGIPKAPAMVGVGIPKEALARRPDIYQARQEAIAQLASIGAIKANLFPSFSLAGTFAFAANNIPPNSINDMFNWSNRTITAGPGVNWPLLNYGQITNAVRAQDAVFQQALLNYMNLVLQAQKEVQDHITGFVEARKSEQYLVKAVHSAIQTTHLTFIRYREGESDFTPVLNAEQQQLQVQTSWVNAQSAVPLALVELYRALGGGWQIRKCDDIVPLPIKDAMAERTNWGNLLIPQQHMPPQTELQKITQRYLPNW